MEAVLTHKAEKNGPIVSFWRRLWTKNFLTLDKEIFISKISLIYIFFFLKSEWYLHVPIKFLALYMLLVPRPLELKKWWIVIASVSVLINAMEYFTLDNHKFLTTYWILVCLIACYSLDPERVFRINARRLIGLSFLTATWWKFYAGEYLNGKFMLFNYLTDERFGPFAHYIGRVPIIDLFTNYDWSHYILKNPLSYQPTFLKSTEILNRLALVSSWWVLLIEGLVAFFFLIPEKWKIAKWGDLCLVVFIVTTYSLVSVKGFNYLLVVMGLAQCTKKSRWVNIYLLVLVWTEVKSFPYMQYLTFLRSW